MARGLLDYFPLALAAVAELSRVANEQHNPGEPMHWSREKSADHADCIIRHLIDRGRIDSDGCRHSVKVAWRALALAQLELERAAVEAGTPLAQKQGATASPEAQQCATAKPVRATGGILEKWQPGMRPVSR